MSSEGDYGTITTIFCPPLGMTPLAVNLRRDSPPILSPSATVTSYKQNSGRVSPLQDFGKVRDMVARWRCEEIGKLIAAKDK